MKIYAFGDSYTNGFDDINAEWVKEYIKWKGYKPKSYIDIISEHYNAEVHNFAKQGNDNYSILESFFKKFFDINKEDIIIINWSDVTRFRVTDIHDKWKSIIPQFREYILIENFLFSEKTFDEILINRLSPRYIDEINNYIHFIFKLCADRKIFQWMVDMGYNLDCVKIPETEKIIEETNGKIKDHHYSEKGNLILANLILDHLKK
jgi:hypothetical protein